MVTTKKKPHYISEPFGLPHELTEKGKYQTKCRFKKGNKVTLDYHPWESGYFFKGKEVSSIPIHATIKKAEKDKFDRCVYGLNIKPKSIKCLDSVDREALSVKQRTGFYEDDILKRQKEEYCD